MKNKVKIIRTQEKQITTLDGANQRLLNVLGQLGTDKGGGEGGGGGAVEESVGRKVGDCAEVIDEEDSPMTPTSPPPPELNMEGRSIKDPWMIGSNLRDQKQRTLGKQQGRHMEV